MGGELDLFSNVADGAWIARPNTILVDSAAALLSVRQAISIAITTVWGA